MVEHSGPVLRVSTLSEILTLVREVEKMTSEFSPDETQSLTVVVGRLIDEIVWLPLLPPKGQRWGIGQRLARKEAQGTPVSLFTL